MGVFVSEAGKFHKFQHLRPHMKWSAVAFYCWAVRLETQPDIKFENLAISFSMSESRKSFSVNAFHLTNTRRLSPPSCACLWRI